MGKKDEAEPTHMRRIETQVTRTLPVALSADEVNAISKRMAHAVSEISRCDEEEKEVKAQFKSRRATQEAEVNRCASLINAGREYRDVACTKTQDFEVGQIYVTRDDTNDEVNRRR